MLALRNCAVPRSHLAQPLQVDQCAHLVCTQSSAPGKQPVAAFVITRAPVPLQQGDAPFTVGLPVNRLRRGTGRLRAGGVAVFRGRGKTRQGGQVDAIVKRTLGRSSSLSYTPASMFSLRLCQPWCVCNAPAPRKIREQLGYLRSHRPALAM